MKKSMIALVVSLIIYSNQQATTPIGKDPCSPLVRKEIAKHRHLMWQVNQQERPENLIKELAESMAHLEALLKKRENLAALIKDREKQEISADLKDSIAVNKKLIGHDRISIIFALGDSASYLVERADTEDRLSRYHI